MLHRPQSQCSHRDRRAAMTTKEGIRVASVDRILQRVRTDDNFTVIVQPTLESHPTRVKPVRYFGQRNGARHNPYAAGVKKYELNGGRFNNDATTAYDLPRPIKSRGGRPVKNSPGSTDANSDNSIDSAEPCGTTSPAQSCTAVGETVISETSETKAEIQASVENSEIMQVKTAPPQRTALRRSTRSCVREIEAKQQPPAEHQAKGSSSGDDDIVLMETEKPQCVEEELKTPPPLLQHPISVVMPSGLGSSATSRPPQAAPALPMLFNKGAQCWIPVAPQLAAPLATWHHEAQEFVTAPECYWIAGLAPSAKSGCRDSAGITPGNVTPDVQSELKDGSRRPQNLTAIPFNSSGAENNSPYSWTIEDVVTFISRVPGCAKHSEAFRSQEIDGEALLLLDVDQLVSRLGMKLGPAAKVWARLSKLTGHS